MKKLMYIMGFFLLFSLSVKAQKINVKEIYYYVSEKGEINKDRIIKRRTLTYKPGRGCVQVEYHHGGSKTDIDTYNDILRKFPEKVFDENKRVIETTEWLDSTNYIKHHISYTQYGDPAEIKSVHYTRDKAPQTSTIVFDYFYSMNLPDNKSGKVNENAFRQYYRFGITPMEKGCPWLLRTIKKDGMAVQFAERKYGRN